MKIRLTQQPTVGGDSLTTGREYDVLGIEADDYRILNDTEEPCLYEPEHFTIVDSSEPTFWICDRGEDGERYAYPREWNTPGFFEDYFDRVEAARKQFWTVHARLYRRKTEGEQHIGRVSSEAAPSASPDEPST
jgi:hypothetical protein